MKKTGFIIVIVGALITSCIPLLTPVPNIQAPPTSTYSPLPVIVPPFYNATEHRVNVGNYSQQLSTFEYTELASVADEMKGKKIELTPEQMFVLAIRLFELGDNDNAVYWFYEAQFRAKLFLIAREPSRVGSTGDPSFELPNAYNAFTQLATEYINGYAGCDIENWIIIAQKVRDDNPTPPELDRLFPGVVFVERSQWLPLNQQVAEGLDGFISYLSNNKESIKQQRTGSNADSKYCASAVTN